MEIKEPPEVAASYKAWSTALHKKTTTGSTPVDHVQDPIRFSNWQEAVVAGPSHLNEPDSVSMEEFKKQEKLANTDRLTGLQNNNALEDRLERMKNNEEHNVGIFMVDAAKFKVVNDTFGHEAGDTFLRRIGIILTDSVGSVSVYRRGGDEFVLIVNDITSADKMDAIGERLTRYFNQAQDAEGKIIPSVSIGGFFLGENASDIEREVCLQAADQALAVIKAIRAAEPDRKNLEGYWIGQNKVSCEIPLSGYLPFVPEVAIPEIVPGVSTFGTLESLRQLGAPRIETSDSDAS